MKVESNIQDKRHCYSSPLVNKRSRKPNWQSRMDNPETLATLGTLKTKTNKKDEQREMLTRLEHLDLPQVFSKVIVAHLF